MHDDREAGDLVADILDHVEVESLFALEFIGAVAGTEGGSQ